MHPENKIEQTQPLKTGQIEQRYPRIELRKYAITGGLMPTNSLELPDRLKKRFITDFTEIAILDKRMKFLEVKNLDVILPEIVTPSKGNGKDRPFWVKIWESSVVLAYYLANLPVKSGQKMLEIGAGMGVTGIAAASFGHDVTITDNNEDALEFARVNAAANGLENLPVRSLDWNHPNIDEKWDVIFGADVVYAESGFEMLVDFLRAHLKQDGTIYLALSGFIRGTQFFQAMSRYFAMKKKTMTMRSDEEQFQIQLYIIRFK
jgi:predicted nicotinamide N-methyase